MKNILKLRYLVLLIILALGGMVYAANYNKPPIIEAPKLTKNGQPAPVSSSASSTSSTIEVTEQKIGEGRELKKGDEATFHYIGTLENGSEFDSSVRRDVPFTVVIGEGKVIKGWDEGLPGMKVGGKRKLLIPAALAYGSRATPKIPANSPLIFEVELLSIK